MQLLDWPLLDALQAGALLTLFISFITEAYSRRDRMMGWLALACLLVALRHAAMAAAVHYSLNPELLDRAQSLFVALGFLALATSLARLFPIHVPASAPAWLALGMVPNLVRNLLLPRESPLEPWVHHSYNLTYLVGCGLFLYWLQRAREEGDLMARRVFFGFLCVTLPVVVEITAFSLFNVRIRLSGLSLLILAMTISASWQWVVVGALESRIHRAETEVELWRNLVPGTAFRTDRPSPLMESLFGPDWADLVKAAPGTPHQASDGHTYSFRSRVLHHQEHLGWCERDERNQGTHQGFLAGWTVGLGVDDAQESARLQEALQAWGAEVEAWGTIPPREGPYPSVLLWAREPSILAVWREDNLKRRRPRWIQIGGPATEGPHARLEPGAPVLQLQQLLEGLLSRR